MQVEFEKPEMKLETLLEYGNLLVQEQENVKRVQLADSYLSGAELAGGSSTLNIACMHACHMSHAVGFRSACCRVSSSHASPGTCKAAASMRRLHPATCCCMASSAWAPSRYASGVAHTWVVCAGLTGSSMPANLL